jgi:uncharacterized protein YeaC (DUF1315 family)
LFALNFLKKKKVGDLLSTCQDFSNQIQAVICFRQKKKNIFNHVSIKKTPKHLLKHFYDFKQLKNYTENPQSTPSQNCFHAQIYYKSKSREKKNIV